MRQLEQGLYLYSDEGQVEIKLPTDRSPRDLVMSEFHDSIVGKTPAPHDVRWGLANVEVCDAAIASSSSSFGDFGGTDFQAGTQRGSLG